MISPKLFWFPFYYKQFAWIFIEFPLQIFLCIFIVETLKTIPLGQVFICARFVFTLQYLLFCQWELKFNKILTIHRWDFKLKVNYNSFTRIIWSADTWIYETKESLPKNIHWISSHTGVQFSRQIWNCTLSKIT